LLATALAVVALGGAAGGWRVLSRPATAAGGVVLGRLPGGIDRTALNLVVITLDTTRADHLGAYGATRAATPVLDTLAKDGVLFEQAMTTAPLTLPAHSSILTGAFPPEHGVRDNGGFFLGPEQVTLAELLKERGYRTGGFVAAYVLDRKWGIAQGFETYFDEFETSVRRGGKSAGDIQRPANEVVDRALPWMESAAGQPFFAWIHFYDPHTPYAPPEPFKSRYSGDPYSGEIAFTDTQVGRVVEFLKSKGLLERTVIAVIGDHGESLGEHGEDAHGFFVYEAATRVPFIVRAPFERTRGRRVADPVRAVDLMPTVLDLLGVAPPSGIAGVTLTPLLTGERQELGLEGYAEAMYPLHHYGWSDLRALRSGRYKVIDAPRPELYDLQEDPKETSNLFESRRALGDRMVGRLRELEQGFSQVSSEPPSTDVDPEVRARLAALGYVGTFVASASDPRTDRADPKDKVALFNTLNEAREATADKDSFAQVVALLRSVVDEDPDVIDGWFKLGNAYFRVGRFKESIEYYGRALQLKPDYDIAVINIAAAYRNLGDDEAALAGFEHYLTLDPKDPYVRYQMGEIYLDRGDLAKAEQVFNEALAIDGRVAQAKNALGVIAFKRGQIADAERLVKEAIEMKADVRLARYNLALIAEQRGDVQTAERHYLEELKNHPDSHLAAFNLSRLYEASGNRALEIDSLRQAIEGNPRFAEGHIFLAKALLDEGKFEEAISLARKGIELKPRAEVEPLGHFVLADLYNRVGRSQDAAQEVAKGRALEARSRTAH
jgi:arylsulfatase A-like enzyme/cytochrome c-type biogenesis protein CcmH/NrfG